MKLKFLTAVASLAIFTAAGAIAQSTLDRSGTWSLTGSNQTFTFTQFNSALGNLTAVQLILNSSAVSGSVNVTNNIGDVIEIDNIRSRIQFSGTGFSTTSTTNTQLIANTSPALPFSMSGSTSQAFTVSTTSLLGLPSTTSISSGSFASYTGSGDTPNFTARLLNSVSSDAQDPIDDLTSLFSFTAPNTSVTLRYTYTPATAPVPEPGQVAASLLLLGGIGAYVFIKRRKKTAPAAA